MLDAGIMQFTNTYEPALADRIQTLLNTSRDLGSTRWASLARASSIPFIFDGMEQVFASECEPVSGITELFDRLDAFFKATTSSGIGQLGAPAIRENTKISGAIENVTGNHYGRLFSTFSETSFWDEPVSLLRTRLERNNVDISQLIEHEVLDTGCGGGRYTVAWKLLGAKRAVGIDISPIAITSAHRRVRRAGVVGVSFQVGSVLDLPYRDNSFDIVFSNGVLHHTVDWGRGIAELVRVLKPDGRGWLYMIENPGGLFWRVIEALRELMKGEDREYIRAALETLGIPNNRIFYMLDHVMVPINLRIASSEIEHCLSLAGATNIRRLKRGADFDRIEQIYRGIPYAELIYGMGENRYVFSK